MDVRDDYIVDLDADGDPVGVEMLGMADDAVRAASDLT